MLFLQVNVSTIKLLPSDVIILSSSIGSSGIMGTSLNQSVSRKTEVLNGQARVTCLDAKKLTAVEAGRMQRGLKVHL